VTSFKLSNRGFCKPKPPKFPSPVNFPVFDAWHASVEGAKALCGLESAPQTFRF
jgi:hypothetical protein